jgi:hypothetical protein
MESLGASSCPHATRHACRRVTRSPSSCLGHVAPEGRRHCVSAQNLKERYVDVFLKADVTRHEEHVPDEFGLVCESAAVSNKQQFM